MDSSGHPYFALLADRTAVNVAIGILMERHLLDVADAERALFAAADRWESTVAQAARRIIGGADAGS